MSIDSYFFASFSDNDRAFAAIQERLDERPSFNLPQMASKLSLRTIPTTESDSAADAKKESSSGPLGIKKLGSVLKPFKSRNSDQAEDADSSDSHSGISIPFLSKTHKQSQDSLVTLRNESIGPQDEEGDGYPPKQSGLPPRGLHDDSGKGWSGWIRKPATKIFGTSPNQSSAHDPSSSEPELGSGLTDSPVRPVASYAEGHKRPSVTEVIEPTVPSGSDDELNYRRSGGSNRAARDSFTSQSSSDGQSHNRSEYSMIEQSESGNREDAETAKTFRDVFSLTEKEELIDRATPQCEDESAYANRLPWVLVPRLASFWPILCIDKLLLFPIVTALI